MIIRHITPAGITTLFGYQSPPLPTRSPATTCKVTRTAPPPARKRRRRRRPKMTTA